VSPSPGEACRRRGGISLNPSLRRREIDGLKIKIYGLCNHPLPFVRGELERDFTLRAGGRGKMRLTIPI